MSRMKINSLLNSLKYYHAWSGDGGCHCGLRAHCAHSGDYRLSWLLSSVPFNESDIVYVPSDTREKFIILHYKLILGHNIAFGTMLWNTISLTAFPRLYNIIVYVKPWIVRGKSFVAPLCRPLKEIQWYKYISHNLVIKTSTHPVSTVRVGIMRDWAWWAHY